MTKLMKAAVTLAILTSLTACDESARNDLRREREDGAYHTAMADYKAGRIEQAIKGFEKVVCEDPANASARFQLACLQQDLRRDYVSAFCNYREYLNQHRESDKAALARDRQAVCEQEMAKALAEKYGLGAGVALAKEAETARKVAREAESARRKLEKDLSEATRRIAAMEADRKRLVTLMKTDTDKEVQTPSAPAVKDVKALLEEEDNDEGDRIQMSRDVAALKIEEKDEMEESSSLLPAQPEGAKARRDAARAASRAAAKPQPAEPLHESRPKTYVVQEGETLMQIAMRFYGNKNAWLKIRNANKALITPVGNVNAGVTIALP